MHAIEELAEYSVARPDGLLSVRTKKVCSILVTDLLAAVAAGFRSDLAIAARKAATNIYGPGAASLWLSPQKLSIAGAAMANAAAASSLDIDDGHRGAAGHPGAGVIPAVLAVAETIDASDERIFDAIAIGYDVALRVAAARPTPTIETYSSGRWVNYGVAAAAGRLLRLTPNQVSNAIAISGAEGPISVKKGASRYQGSTVKEVIPPAVVAGLTGAFRAQAGATGPLDLLDNEEFFTRSVLTSGIGDRWWLEDCYLKPYACCRYMHSAIDAILEMRRPGAPIRSLRIETFQRGTELSNERAPRTLEGAQYSFYFSCALAALYGAKALQPVDTALLHDRNVLDLADRIELFAHPDFANSFPKGTPCRVIIDQGQGPEICTVEFPLGDVANPMSHQQVIDKFKQISSRSLSPAWQNVILEAAGNLPTAGFRPLYASLGNSLDDADQPSEGELV